MSERCGDKEPSLSRSASRYVAWPLMQSSRWSLFKTGGDTGIQSSGTRIEKAKSTAVVAPGSWHTCRQILN